jgi:hypothetical protein
LQLPNDQFEDWNVAESYDWNANMRSSLSAEEILNLDTLQIQVPLTEMENQRKNYRLGRSHFTNAL